MNRTDDKQVAGTLDGFARRAPVVRAEIPERDLLYDDPQLVQLLQDAQGMRKRARAQEQPKAGRDGRASDPA